MACSTSFFMTLPPAPLPETAPRSMPFFSAILRARGEALMSRSVMPPSKPVPEMFFRESGSMPFS